MPEDEPTKGRYHVRIHELRGYSFYVDAESPDGAEAEAWGRWQGGSCGEEDEEESIESNVCTVELADDEPAALGGRGGDDR